MCIYNRYSMSIIKKVFHYEENKISVIKCNDEIWFRGKSVAQSLGYLKPLKALDTHVNKEDKRKLSDLEGAPQNGYVFGFHTVNFPFMSSNIPSAPAYGVYESQLVRYARCCSSYSDFLIHHRALAKRLLSQGYKVNRLSNTFKKFYGRHTDLVGQYKKNVCQMFADSIS